MLLSGHYRIFGGLLKTDRINHFLAEESLQIFVQTRGAGPAFDNGSGGTDNLFWNRGIWTTSSDTEKTDRLKFKVNAIA
jgi:hypothetical protein